MRTDEDDDDSKTNLFSPSALPSAVIGKTEREGGRGTGVAARSNDSAKDQRETRLRADKKRGNGDPQFGFFCTSQITIKLH